MSSKSKLAANLREKVRDADTLTTDFCETFLMKKNSIERGKQSGGKFLPSDQGGKKKGRRTLCKRKRKCTRKKHKG